MPSLLPLLYLIAFAITSVSADTFVWSKVDTAKLISTSSLVWSKVETSKSSSSPSPSSTSPIVWSKVVTSTPSSLPTTSTQAWTRVITTRTPSSTTLATSTTSSPSATFCSQNYSTSALPTCLGYNRFEWSKVNGYRNYEGDKVDSAMERSSGFLSGRPCPNFDIRDAKEGIMLLSVSEQFAELHGGFENICGKELWIVDGKATRVSWTGLGGTAVIAHSCSEEYCQGASFGVGGLYNHREPFYLSWYRFVIGAQLLPLPDKQHEARVYQWSWINRQ